MLRGWIRLQLRAVQISQRFIHHLFAAHFCWSRGDLGLRQRTPIYKLKQPCPNILAIPIAKYMGILSDETKIFLTSDYAICEKPGLIAKRQFCSLLKASSRSA
jgi:hypothetical protein